MIEIKRKKFWTILNSILVCVGVDISAHGHQFLTGQQMAIIGRVHETSHAMLEHTRTMLSPSVGKINTNYMLKANLIRNIHRRFLLSSG